MPATPLRPLPRPAAAAILAIAALTLLPHDGSARPLPTDRWQALMDRTHTPGLAVALVCDTGVVAVATLGLRDVEHHRPVTRDTRFYIASCTKTMVATAVWALAERGELDLDAPVRSVYPAFHVSDPGMTDSLTLRDLLAHRQGLDCPVLSYGTAYSGFVTDSLFDRLLGRATARRRFRYANLHYLILGRVLQIRTGTPWPRALQREVFDPIGMARATCSASTLYGDRDVAFPYVWEHGALIRAHLKTDRTMHAAGGVGASLEDLCRWIRVQLGDGRLDGRSVLPAAMIRGMRASVVDVPDRHPLRGDWARIGWSAGWEIRTLAGDTMFVHTGQYAGSTTHFSFIPSRNLGVIVLTNGNFPGVPELVAGEAFDAALDRETPDTEARLARFLDRFLAPPAADSLHGRLRGSAKDTEGRFFHPDWGTLDVSVTKSGALEIRNGDYPMPIHMSGDDRFLADGDPGSLVRDAAGRVQSIWMQMEAPDSVRFDRVARKSR